MKQQIKTDGCILFLLTIFYTVNRIYLKGKTNTPCLDYILKCHFNDFLAGIAIISYINIALLFSCNKEVRIDTYRLSIVITICCGLIWEYVLPSIFQHGVSDIYDVVAYISGGIVYVFLKKLTDE